MRENSKIHKTQNSLMTENLKKNREKSTGVLTQ